MITFDLELAHPEYQDLIRGILGQCAIKYPWGKLSAVRLYQGKERDHSLGNADKPYEIALNSHWFTKPLKVLQQAASTDEAQFINGIPILWHGLMLEEPEHVLIHEFGHVLAQSLPDFNYWAFEGWLKATADVGNAVSGYACTNPDEFFAETFCAVEMGLAPELGPALQELMNCRSD